MTEQPAKSNAMAFAFAVTKRVARFLLPMGFGLGDFLQAAKAAFVTAAAQQLEKSGTRPSTARIATVTGLTRAEVARIRSNHGILEPHSAAQRAERVMHGWFTDAKFVDQAGKPSALSINGENSFTELVRLYSGDIPKQAILAELRAGGMVSTDASGRLIAVRRYYLASQSPKMDLAALAGDISTLFASAENGEANGASTLRRLSITFPNGISPAVRRTLELRTERFLDSLSDYLHAEAGTQPVLEPQSDQDAITLRFVISQSTLEDE